MKIQSVYVRILILIQKLTGAQLALFSDDESWRVELSSLSVSHYIAANENDPVRTQDFWDA